MASRRLLREQALQMLFELDMNKDETSVVLERSWFRKTHDHKDRAFVERMVKGVRNNISAIDEKLAAYARNWDIKRMAVVDRNVLRMAIFEMLFCDDVPAVVAINEAVDIAKYFNSAESGRFVNGILDRLRKDMKQASKAKAAKQSD